MLIRVNMEDLREQTHTRHYELYRRCKLEEMGFKDTDPESQPFRWAALVSTSSVQWESSLGSQWCLSEFCGQRTAHRHKLASNTAVLKWSGSCLLLIQPPRNIWDQKKRVPWWAAEERGRNEANVCEQSQGDGSTAERQRKRGEWIRNLQGDSHATHSTLGSS